ncbi:RES domain-containing protein [Pseudomonas sp. NFXW11]|uniref:RES domain-containing protein n=1 Tax=Pseudomonas sp. NFXW11 TaxID=2819531 RepID=UPI003CF493C9
MSMLEMDSEGATKEDLSQIEGLLRKISCKELKRRIESFNKNYKTFGSDDIYEKIKDVFMIQVGSLRAGAFPAQEKEYDPAGIFYRARIWRKEFEDLPGSEFWAAPGEKIEGYGRINRPAQGLLYTSEGQIHTTFEEIRATPQSKVLLMAYQAKETLRVATMGSRFGVDLSSDAKKKLDLIRKFINQNLLAAGEGAYLFSSEFTNSIMNSSPDGWAYPSTLVSGGENVCFRPESQHKLELLEVFAFSGTENGKLAPVGFFLPKHDGHYEYQADSEAADARLCNFILKHRRMTSSNDRSTLEQRKTVSTTTRLIP